MSATPMQRALALAQSALAISPPNPAVGCVLCAADGSVIGEGFTQAVGGAHAEIMALRDAAERGHATAGASAYVTLEPCAHHGRTPPCVDALIAAQIAHVSVALLDPNPFVAGKGLHTLQAAGITTQLYPRDSAEAMAAQACMQGFLHRMETGLPWLRLKAAASLDGVTALPNGQSQWITGEAARADGQNWRARSGCVLTGIGTILADNPLLNVRASNASRQPHLAILDRQLRTPLDAAFWQTMGNGRECWIFTDSRDDAKTRALESQGAHVHPSADLHTVVQLLGQRQINEVHIEAGATLNGALLHAGLVDELLLYLAPSLLGSGLGIAQLPVLNQLNQGIYLHDMQAQAVGADLRILAKIHRNADPKAAEQTATVQTDSE